MFDDSRYRFSVLGFPSKESPDELICGKLSGKLLPDFMGDANVFVSF